MAAKAFIPEMRIELCAVFYREGKYWVAHCLEMDLVGHGKSKRTAFVRMNQAILEQVNRSVSYRNYENIIQPADAKFFEMFFAGKNVMRGKFTLERVSKEDIAESARDFDAGANVEDSDWSRRRDIRVKIDPAVESREYHNDCVMA